MKVAWRTTWKGFVAVVAAEKRSQAVAVTVGGATDAGYKPRWVDVRARRAPEHDGWASQDRSGHCWAEEHLAPLPKFPEV